MKKLVDLRNRLQAEQAALSSQLEAIRASRASAVKTSPFDEQAAILAVARAKTKDLLDGTDTATALKDELHTQREAIAEERAAEERADCESLRSERHLMADAEMLTVQIRQINQDIEAGLKSAAREAAAKELKNYSAALAKLHQSLIQYAAASQLAGEGKLPTLLEFALPFPLGADVPESVSRYFRREGYGLLNVHAYTHEAVAEGIQNLRSDLLGRDV